MAERCDNCKFWHIPDHKPETNDSPNDREGLCRRYPPVIIELLVENEVRFRMERDGDEYDDISVPQEMATASYNATFPATVGCGWCGEYREGTK